MTSKSLGKLKQLPVNKTVVFYSPIEGDDVLVRTGTIGEGSCFFHSILHSYSKDYSMMDKKDRMKLVLKLRAGLSGKMDKESWENMGEGNIARIPFEENIMEILISFYNFLENQNSNIRGRATRRVVKQLIGSTKEKLEIYEIISEILPLKDAFQKVILPKAYKNARSLSEYNIVIDKQVQSYISKNGILTGSSKEQTRFILSSISELIELICMEAYDLAFKTYKKGLENIGTYVDSYSINYIADRFNRDIYFLNGNNRVPYNNCDTVDTLKGRKSIIIIWINKNHYEIVGRLLPGNRIQREFDATDPLIKKLKMFLLEPEKIRQQYPELSSHIPKSKNDDSDSDNNSEYSPRRRSRSQSDNSSAQDSDPYYDDSDNHSDDSSESDHSQED